MLHTLTVTAPPGVTIQVDDSITTTPSLFLINPILTRICISPTGASGELGVRLLLGGQVFAPTQVAGGDKWIFPRGEEIVEWTEDRDVTDMANLPARLAVETSNTGIATYTFQLRVETSPKVFRGGLK